ncbi:MAG: hypothetical protein K6G69_06435 [Lachnospiraceae bacterium]|nr:hypothetical protein [Lachnospiraceae bacterium]
MKDKNNKIYNFVIIALGIIGTILMFRQKESAIGLTTVGLANFKFFTVQSNYFCVIVAILWILTDKADEKKKKLMITMKLMAASAVGLTFAIVAFFLGPLYGHILLYQDANLIFHLLLPLVAIAEFVFLDVEERIPLNKTLFAMIPSFLYGTVYLLNNLINGAGEWPDGNDWYGFLNWGLPIGIMIYLGVILVTWFIACILRAVNQVIHMKQTRIIRITSVVFLGILLIAAVILLFVMPKIKPDITDKPDITAEPIGCIGNHVYYPENMFLSEGRSEEQNAAIKSYLESLDKTLDEDVYITLCMDYPAYGRIDVSATAYVNGVVLSYFPYTATTENDKGLVQKFSRMVRPELDTSGLLDPNELIPSVKAFASQNTDKMYMDRGDTIYGTYLLKYDMEKEKLYYEYTLNEWSYVNVDARSGEIIGWNFYDGVIY